MVVRETQQFKRRQVYLPRQLPAANSPIERSEAGNGSGVEGFGREDMKFRCGTWHRFYIFEASIIDDGYVNPSSDTAIFVVYDVNGGFVNGGGWIDSQAGAYTADSTAVGKAKFGFVSKYHIGAQVPTGKTAGTRYPIGTDGSRRLEAYKGSCFLLRCS